MTVQLSGIGHVGIRVSALEPALAFYGLLGFRRVAGPFPGEPVVVLDHPAGMELNLIVNAAERPTDNVLMDVPTKHAGITHVALAVARLDDAMAALEAAGIPLSGGPVTFPNGARSIFVRDPDRTVIELTQAPTAD